MKPVAISLAAAALGAAAALLPAAAPVLAQTTVASDQVSADSNRPFVVADNRVAHPVHRHVRHRRRHHHHVVHKHM